MSRRQTKKKRPFLTDPLYQSIFVQLVANRLIRHGKKSLAYSLLYAVLQNIQQETNREPVAILEYAIRTVTPAIQLKSRRVGGTNYQVPVEVNPQRGSTIAIQWILTAASNRPGRNIINRLSIEILDAACGNGGAVRKRDETHRIAEANKAFALYRF
jgi:small subunit ribosomal protein S7